MWLFIFSNYLIIQFSGFNLNWIECRSGNWKDRRKERKEMEMGEDVIWNEWKES